MNVPFLNLSAQYQEIRDEIDAAIAQVIAKTAFVGGPFVKSFEENFAQFIGAKHAIGLNSGTAADQLAIQALIKPGDEVITSDPTFLVYQKMVQARGGVNRVVPLKRETEDHIAGHGGGIERPYTSRRGFAAPQHEGMKIQASY